MGRSWVPVLPATLLLAGDGHAVVDRPELLGLRVPTARPDKLTFERHVDREDLTGRELCLLRNAAVCTKVNRTLINFC